MSALAGILNFGTTAPPVDEYLLAQLGMALNSRGPDGGDDLVAANVGMSYRAFHTNRESRLEVQPLVASEGHMLTWNGRLDNRRELISQLRDYLKEEITDLSIVMAAYLKWERGCFVRLVGDFCLALWDARLRRLYLVRDVAGARPLNYYIDDSRIVWSTEPAALLSVIDKLGEINEEYIAGAMTVGARPGVTPFKNITAIEPAHVATVTIDGQLHSERFWTLLPEKKIRYRTDEEYQEHGLHEFTEAVRCRLRSDRPLFAELSGGLDSSSIVCLSDKIIAEGGVQTPIVETVSQVFDESPTSDERKYIAMVETQRGVRTHFIKDQDYPLLAPVPKEITIVSPNPIVLSFGFHSRISQTMDFAGARVIMSGLGGDQMFGGVYGAYPEVADGLSSMNLLALHRSLRSWSNALKRSYVDLLWKEAIVRLLPPKLQASAIRQTLQIPPWYNRGFASRLKLDQRLFETPTLSGFRLPSARDQVAGFLSTVKNISSCWRHEQFGIEVTYPFAHRPLVEFLQAIPLAQLLRPGENRFLMRRMMAGILPDEIAKRRTKGNPREAIFRAIAREADRLRAVFENAQVCARGYVDKEPLLAALDRAKHGLESHSAFLVQTISLEFWLRGLENQLSLTRNLAVVPRKRSWACSARSVPGAV